MSELEDALRVIKEKCKSSENCKECPFRTYEGEKCEITSHVPERWHFKTDEPENIPRIFV